MGCSVVSGVRRHTLGWRPCYEGCISACHLDVRACPDAGLGIIYYILPVVLLRQLHPCCRKSACVGTVCCCKWHVAETAEWFNCEAVCG